MDVYRSIEVMDSLGRGYHNVYEMAKKLGIDSQDVIYALNNGTTVGPMNTRVYKYSDRMIYSENLGRMTNPGERLPESKWEIRNEDTGVFYKDGADAARKIGCTRAMVSMCLSGKRKTCKGFRLKRVIDYDDNWENC